MRRGFAIRNKKRDQIRWDKNRGHGTIASAHNAFNLGGS
jgi:hypothetical protein